MTWNPQQYLKYAQPRLRPALDLLARIEHEDPATIYDLGCGTGHITRMLADRWPRACVTGIDDDSAMIAQAGQQRSAIRWVQQSVATWSADFPTDLIYSNAALQWLPNHAVLFPRLMGSLAAGGVLAVQMPNNFSAPSHTAIHETARNGPWRAKLENRIAAGPVRDAAFYYSILQPHARAIDIWETQYLHVLEGADPVKEWTKGTWLRPFLDALEEPERSEFESQYAQRVREAYPPLPDGRTLFPFRRLFIIAVRN